MPAHWIYKVGNIVDTFGGKLDGYRAAPHPHPESFMVGMGSIGVGFSPCALKYAIMLRFTVP